MPEVHWQREPNGLPAYWSRQPAEPGKSCEFPHHGCKVLLAGCRQLRGGSPRSPELTELTRQHLLFLHAAAAAPAHRHSLDTPLSFAEHNSRKMCIHSCKYKLPLLLEANAYTFHKPFSFRVPSLSSRCRAVRTP